MKTTVKYLFWIIICAAAVTAPAWGRALAAHADPNAVPYAVCAELGSNPTIFNVTRVLEEVEATGLTTIQASTVVVESVTSTCPQYVPLLRRFIDTFGPQDQRPRADVRTGVVA